MLTTRFSNLVFNRIPSGLARVGKRLLAYAIGIVRADRIWWLISALLLAIALVSHKGIGPAHAALIGETPATSTMTDRVS